MTQLSLPLERSISVKRPLLAGLPLQLAICAGILVAYGLLVRWSGSQTGIRSGAPPLYAWWKTPAFLRHPLYLLYSVPPILLFLFWQGVIKRQNRRPLPDWVLLIAAVLFIFTFNIAVCLIDTGPNPGEKRLGYPAIFYEIARPFDYPGVEFATDLHFVRSARQFLREYVSLHGELALHCRTHPPGPVLFLWYAQRAFGGGLMPAALISVALSALSAVPVFLIARRLYGRRVATIALALLAMTPSFVIFGATSMDGVYMLPLLTSIYLFFAAADARRPALAIALAAALGTLLATSALMTFTTSCLGVLFLLYAIVARLRLENWRRIWMVLLSAATTFILLYVALYRATGYNLIECLKVSMSSDTEVMGRRGGSLARYLDLSIANLAAFGIGIGFLVTLLLAKQARAALLRMQKSRPFDALLVVFIATMILLGFCTLFRWETERIWVFLAPLAIFPAARYIAQHAEPRADGRQPLLEFSLSALFAQTLLMQTFLFMLW